MLKLDPKKFRTTTERLALRPYSLDDYDSWLAGVSCRLDKQNMFDTGPLAKKYRTKAHYRVWVTRLNQLRATDRVYMLGVFDQTNGESVGLVSFGAISRLSYQFANLGYEINNQYWGQGYATEAVRAALPLAFKQLKLHRIEAGIQPKNLASIRVAKRAGLKREGVREKYLFDGKRWIDLVYFRALAEDFGVRSTKPTIGSSFADYL